MLSLSLIQCWASKEANPSSNGDTSISGTDTALVSVSRKLFFSEFLTIQYLGIDIMGQLLSKVRLGRTGIWYHHWKRIFEKTLESWDFNSCYQFQTICIFEFWLHIGNRWNKKIYGRTVTEIVGKPLASLLWEVFSFFRLSLIIQTHCTIIVSSKFVQKMRKPHARKKTWTMMKTHVLLQLITTMFYLDEKDAMLRSL